MARWWNVVIAIGFGVASIIGRRRGARDLGDFLRRQKIGLSRKPWLPTDDEFEQACRKYEMAYVLIGVIFILFGVRSLFGLARG
jgi:hypothetical protein